MPDDGTVLDNVVVHHDAMPNDLRDALLAHQGDVRRATEVVHDISVRLLTACREWLADDAFVPLLVLRGGLLMRDAVEAVFGPRPFGAIVVRRTKSGPLVLFASVPRAGDREPAFALLDPVIATGATALASLAAVQNATGGGRMMVVAPFATDVGVRAVAAHGDVTLHTRWAEEEMADGRLVAFNFDTGDYAFGGGGHHCFVPHRVPGSDMPEEA